MKANITNAGGARGSDQMGGLGQVQGIHAAQIGLDAIHVSM